MSSAFASSPAAADAAALSVSSLNAAAQPVLAAYAEQPGDPDIWQRLLAFRRAAAASIAGLPANKKSGPDVDSALQLIQTFAESGAQDHLAAPEDLELARGYRKKGWTGLLAAMLLVPAWQWPEAPRLDDAPMWLWSAYTAYLFYSPQGFCACGLADAYAAHYLRRLPELLHLAEVNPGSSAVRGALTVFRNTGNNIPLYFTGDSLCRHYALRGRILTLADGVGREDDLLPVPREGRKLRVGFVNRHFGSQTETYTTLPTFEQLDPERFEVILFAHHSTQSPLEDYARRHAADFRLLPAELGAQVQMLRDAALDILVFGTNVTAVFNAVTRLALHRLAPLQIVNNSSCTTSGMPQADLYVSGTFTEAKEAPEHFTERLGLLPGPAHAFNYEADKKEPTTHWTRAALGLPEEAIVFVSAANFYKITPEMQEAWAKILVAVPGSRLLVHPFNPNWSSSYPIKRFCADFDRVLTKHGVASDRFVVSSMKFPSRTDVKELLRVGDIYLDTCPFAGVNSLVDPLEAGIPVAVWEGQTFRSRMGGGLLRSLGIEELITHDAAAYHEICVRLATDATWRAAIRQRIVGKMTRAPIFLDPLAASDAFGALMETAYDELLAIGREEFRKQRMPLLAAAVTDPEAVLAEGSLLLDSGSVGLAMARAWQVLASAPNSPAARYLLGRCYLAENRTARAVDYLLAAVQHDEGNPALWQDLAVALRGANRFPEALQALEACVRIDQKRVESWLMFGEWSIELGHKEMAGQVAAILRQLAPDDARVASLVSRATALAADQTTGGSTPLPPAASAPRPKHILIYTDDPEFGGVAQWNHSILLALVARGYRVSCVQTRCDSPLVKEREALGVRHHWLNYDTGKEFGRTLEDRSDAEAIFRQDRPDLVVFSDCCPVSNMAARQAALDLGIPYVVVVHFVGPYLAKNFARQLPALSLQHARAQAIVAVSEENLKLLRGQFGTPATQGQVIHYGRPARFFQPRDEAVRQRLRAEQNIPADAVVCFTAARLTGVKGFVYQLEAIKLLQKTPGAKNIYFVWAGDGDQRTAIAQQVAHLHATDNVRLLGHRWDVSDWHDAADIFVLPSELEGMPLSIMEAMAKGIPVIATAVSGTPEELGDTGKLLPNPAQDPQGVVRQLAETIVLWAKNPAIRQEQGRRGRERAERMFREELMVERTLAVLEAQLARA
jgi:protein O-GlcNAc transferase